MALASDHAGFELKEALKALLEELGHQYHDFGCPTTDSVDYPDYGRPAAEAVADGRFDRGILVCGSGIGMSITANKIRGVRAALVHDLLSARLTREHNDSNVLCLGQSIVGRAVALEIARVWLQGEFAGGRHSRRVDKIRALEGEVAGGP